MTKSIIEKALVELEKEFDSKEFKSNEKYKEAITNATISLEEVLSY